MLAPIADSGDAVLIPTVGSRPCSIVRQVFPRVAVRAVILADRAPCALAEVRAPTLPVRALLTSLFEPQLFVCHFVRSPVDDRCPGAVPCLTDEHEMTEEG